eukprot:tig00000808_g4387.t1
MDELVPVSERFDDGSVYSMSGLRHMMGLRSVPKLHPLPMSFAEAHTSLNLSRISASSSRTPARRSPAPQRTPSPATTRHPSPTRSSASTRVGARSALAASPSPRASYTGRWIEDFRRVELTEEGPDARFDRDSVYHPRPKVLDVIAAGGAGDGFGRRRSAQGSASTAGSPTPQHADDGPMRASRAASRQASPSRSARSSSAAPLSRAGSPRKGTPPSVQEYPWRLSYPIGQRRPRPCSTLGKIEKQGSFRQASWGSAAEALGWS